MSKVTAFRPQDIRNIVLLGHGGAGKTMLAEAILRKCGATTRVGTIEDGSTTSDFEPEARAHQHSTNSTLLFANYQDREINLIDTPGHPDFVGLALAALPAVETAVIVVNGASGIEFNTRRLFHAAGEAGLARMIVVNKMDVEPSRLPDLVANLKDTFGSAIHCINLPSGGGADVVDCFDRAAGESDFLSVGDVHQEILESTVEIDDAELEKYLSGETIALPELRATFIAAMVSGHVVPVLFTNAKTGAGVEDLLHILVEEAPSPVSGRARRLRKGDTLVEVPCDIDKPFLAHVFKVTMDPYLGQLALVRILQGRLDGDTTFICGADRKPRRAGHVLKVEGRDHPELEAQAYAGDLVALAKIEDIHVNQILHDPVLTDDYAAVLPAYPVPMVSLAIEAKNRNDEAKLGLALQRMKEEDPTFFAAHDSTTHELVVSGIGDLHVRVALEKLKNRANIDVLTKAPTIPYRETIMARAEGHYRHKKQTGGAGQFGEVFLRVEPLGRGEGHDFVDEVFGGAIPSQYIASVEKGVHDALVAGQLAGFPVVDVRVTVTDGKSHPVDSKDVAFRTAGKFAVRDAMEKARPVLLEPVVNLEITAPEANMGDITGHLKLNRGRVMGMETMAAGMGVVRAQAPLAEIATFSTQLRSFTGGQGSYVVEFSHYDPVPPQTQARIAASRQHHKPQDEA